MKVEIKVTDGHNYMPSVKGGAAYTSVGYMGSTYGGGAPCDNEKKVGSAIKNARETIREHGDTPVLRDKRKKATLLGFV